MRTFSGIQTFFSQSNKSAGQRGGGEETENDVYGGFGSAFALKAFLSFPQRIHL